MNSKIINIMENLHQDISEIIFKFIGKFVCNEFLIKIFFVEPFNVPTFDFINKSSDIVFADNLSLFELI